MHANPPIARPQIFDPLLAWAREELGWALASSDDIAGPTQDAATVEAVRAYLEGECWRPGGRRRGRGGQDPDDGCGGAATQPCLGRGWRGTGGECPAAAAATEARWPAGVT
jgi:hypothetical protein